MLRLTAISAVILSLLTTGCQTSMLKQFGEIKPGMEKAQVLNVMGSPSRTQRFHGKDKWTYVFYDDSIRFEKEIQFFEGSAIYVGERSQPDPDKTAVAVDIANEAKNKALDEQLAMTIQQNRKDYDSYESKMRGQDGIRYVPSFESIR